MKVATASVQKKVNKNHWRTLGVSYFGSSARQSFSRLSASLTISPAATSHRPRFGLLPPMQELLLSWQRDFRCPDVTPSHNHFKSFGSRAPCQSTIRPEAR